LDAKWNQRKAYLQQRLSFVAFANDVQQVCFNSLFLQSILMSKHVDS